MIVLRTAQFDDEAARFHLRHNCEDCGFFDVAHERCRHEWPTEAHRAVRDPASSVPPDHVVFCKEFEVA